ncbi:MAG: hypothetical protein ABS934_06375 [Psychrobacillus sp.]
MKKILIFFFLILLMTTSVHALSWAYPFVVWDGNVYEVSKEKVSEEDIGRNIGKVKTKPNDMTGSYYGDASNAYPIGTNYFEIKGKSTSIVIAVEVKNNGWVKANYIRQAPFHWMDIITKMLPGLIILVIVLVFIRQMRNRKDL